MYMLDYEEFQKEEKIYENQLMESKKNLGRKKKKHLVKLDKFKKLKQVIPKNKTMFPDVGGSSYYDHYTGNKFI